jgi:putative transposase
MPRVARVVIPGLPHHVTQRGNNRQDVFFTDDDRAFYLETLRRQSRRHGLELHGFCLMTNHVHLIVTPLTEESLAKAVGRAHQLYAQYINDHCGRIGHLWHSRFFSCPMDDDHYMTGLRYAERNPQRAGLVRVPWEYPWSSAAAHCSGVDPAGLLNLEYWRCLAASLNWREFLCDDDDAQLLESIRKQTRHGRPLGGNRFIDALERRLNRRLRPRRAGRPKKPAEENAADAALEIG